MNNVCQLINTNLYASVYLNERLNTVFVTNDVYISPIVYFN